MPSSLLKAILVSSLISVASAGYAQDQDPEKSTWKPVNWPQKSSEHLFPTQWGQRLGRWPMFPSTKTGNPIACACGYRRH